MNAKRTGIALSAAIAASLLPTVGSAQHAHHGGPPAQQESTQEVKQPKKAALSHHSAQAREPGQPRRPWDGHPPAPHAHGLAPGAIDHGATGHAPMEQETSDDGSMQGAMDHGAMDDGSMHHHQMSHAPGPSAPRTPIPVVTPADRAAAVPPPSDHPVHDNGIFSYVLFNRLESWDADDGRGLEWEGQAWIGTDLNRIWLRSEGERTGGRTENANFEVLYGRSIAPWWDAVAGVRHDFQPGGSQDFAAFGVVGLSPYKFEVEATAYLGESGQSAARLEVEYETLLTNRLILQPLVELNAYGQDDERRGIGSGLSTVEAGLRLRYEVTRRFAPYIGIVHERAFGRTADFRQAEGEATDDTRFVAGVRIWF